jgi:hypothetical protein
MTPPHTSSKVLTVPEARSADGTSGPVTLRRYRIARLRVDARTGASAERFDHLKRSYD